MLVAGISEIGALLPKRQPTFWPSSLDLLTEERSLFFAWGERHTVCFAQKLENASRLSQFSPGLKAILHEG